MKLFEYSGVKPLTVVVIDKTVTVNLSKDVQKFPAAVRLSTKGIPKYSGTLVTPQPHNRVGVRKVLGLNH